jgi:CPA2 family monovalent cation:H+ antiporter-2
MGAAPRRALVVTLQLIVVLIVGLPLVALTQPFVAGFEGPLVLFLLLALLGFAFWRSAANLQGHVRAGAAVIVEALASQSRTEGSTAALPSLAHVNEILPGLGEPVAVRLDGKSPAVGKTLASLRLRGVTGATVLGIARGTQRFVIPDADELLQEGDVLAIAGTQPSVEAAERVLRGEFAERG